MVMKIERMTQLERNSPPGVVKNMEKYNEHFPEDQFNSPLFTGKRIGTAGTFQSTQPILLTAAADDGAAIQSCSAEDLHTAKTRRNPWSHGHGHFESELFFKKRLSGNESRRSSSGSSVPDIIEECESDEETDNDSATDFDYIRCINCSRSNSTTSLDNSSYYPQIINFCYNCKHLKSPQLPAFYQGRRSSWTAGDMTGLAGTCYSPRRSRKSSLTDSYELPMISEPSFDEETNDTKELQLRVKQEVDKLTKFKTNSTTPSRRMQSLLLTLRETNI